MSAFQRGFKTWCERMAEVYRRELGLRATAPLNPRDLAKVMEITVWGPKDIPDFDPKLCARLTGVDASVWSAVTLCFDSRALIILNSAHASSRQTSDLMHEIAHLLLGHTPARVDVSEDGLLVLNTYDKTQEAEADWFAFTLLLPRPVLLSVVAQDCDLDQVARDYGVSRDLLVMRINVTGARIQHQRRRDMVRGQ